MLTLIHKELQDWLLPMLINWKVSVGEAKQELRMVAECRDKYKRKQI